MEYFKLIRKINSEIIFEDEIYTKNIEKEKINQLKNGLEKIHELDDYFNFFNTKENYENFNNSSIEMEFFQEVRNIFLSYWNKNYDKTRKFKVIFFLFASNIFLNNKIYKKGNNFFKEDPTFCSFKNGPILWKVGNEEIYNFFGNDKDIELNYEKWDDDIKDFFKKEIKVLRKCTTEELIKESHKTQCWIKNDYSKGKYKIIPEEEIINEFKVNPPFIFK